MSTITDRSATTRIVPDESSTDSASHAPQPWWTAGRKRRVTVIASQLVVLGAILLAWENLSGPKDASGKLIDEFYVSKPSAIGDALVRWIDQGELWPNVMVTLQESLYGFLIGAGIGLVGGFSLGVSPYLSAVFQPYVSALYSIPRLALVPLFILWFGVGMASKIALVASVVMFLVFYATFAGVRDVDHELIERMRLMRASRLSVHTKATLPSAMTFIVAGLSTAGPFALLIAVAAEMLSSNRGLGYLLVRSSGQFYTAGVFAALLVMMVLGMLLMGAIRVLERRLLRWKPRRPDDVHP